MSQISTQRLSVFVKPRIRLICSHFNVSGWQGNEQEVFMHAHVEEDIDQAIISSLKFSNFNPTWRKEVNRRQKLKTSSNDSLKNKRLEEKQKKQKQSYQVISPLRPRHLWNAMPYLLCFLYHKNGEHPYLSHGQHAPWEEEKRERGCGGGVVVAVGGGNQSILRKQPSSRWVGDLLISCGQLKTTVTAI